MGVKGKKGIFFTLVAIMLITILSVAFAPQDYVTYKDRIPSINSRVDLANDFVKRLKYSYLQSAVETSGRDALVAMTYYINKTSFFASEDSVNKTFVELMFNGSIGGVPIECYLDNKPLRASTCLPVLPITYNVMRGKTLIYKLEAMENASRDSLQIKTRFAGDVTNYPLVLYQSNATGPFRVGLNITFNYSVDAGIASWNVTQLIAASFSIAGVPDPLFLGTARNLNYIYPTDLAGWGKQNFTIFLDKREYRLQSEGPSFLMRLSGNFSTGTGSVCCGIESMVNPQKVIVDKCTRKSYIDWCFYSSNCIPNIAGGGKIWNVSGITTYIDQATPYYGFKIDSFHVGVYNISTEVVQDMGVVTC